MPEQTTKAQIKLLPSLPKGSILVESPGSLMDRSETLRKHAYLPLKMKIFR